MSGQANLVSVVGSEFYSELQRIAPDEAAKATESLLLTVLSGVTDVAVECLPFPIKVLVKLGALAAKSSVQGFFVWRQRESGLLQAEYSETLTTPLGGKVLKLEGYTGVNSKPDFLPSTAIVPPIAFTTLPRQPRPSYVSSNLFKSEVCPKCGGIIFQGFRQYHNCNTSVKSPAVNQLRLNQSQSYQAPVAIGLKPANSLPYNSQFNFYVPNQVRINNYPGQQNTRCSNCGHENLWTKYWQGRVIRRIVCYNCGGFIAFQMPSNWKR